MLHPFPSSKIEETRLAQRAFEQLPFKLKESMRALGVLPGRIEESGAMTLLIDNHLGIQERQVLIERLRALAKASGLEIRRLALLGSQVSARWDDGCVLGLPRSLDGETPRLFTEDGELQRMQPILQPIIQAAR